MHQIRSILKRVNLLFLIKAGIGSAIAIWVASSLGLLYSPSAGIITLLTIQNTKKETLEIALRRILAFVMAVITSYVIFSAIGYHSAAFGLFILVFVGLCIAFKLEDGISMNAVLMTHFLIEGHMAFDLVINEVAILLIGMSIGIFLNLFMPKYRNRIRREQLAVEDAMKEALRGLAMMLRSKDACLIQENSASLEERNKQQQDVRISLQEGNKHLQVGKTTLQEENKHLQDDTSSSQDDNRYLQAGNNLQDGSRQLQEDMSRLREDSFDFTKLDLMLEELLKKAYEDVGNTLLKNTRYLVSYLEMRKNQVEVLKSIGDNINQIPVLLRQSIPLADFMAGTAESYHELNNVEELLQELQALIQHYKDEALPVTREEFEYRAILFQILKQLEYFLIIKRNFVKDLEEENMKNYWTPEQ